MKRFSIGSAIFAVLFLMASIAAAADASVKIGIIDTQKIMRESKAARNARNVFLKDLDAKRAILAAKEKEIRLLEAELKDPDSKWTEEGKKQKAEKLAQEVKEFKRLGSDLEEELKKKDMELTRKILGEIYRILKNFSKNEHYTLILDKNTVIVADETLDITDRVIKLYDAQSK